MTIKESLRDDSKRLDPTVGEPFMAPGGEMFRYPQHFGENVLRHGSHEWLPYSKDEVRLKSSNNNLSLRRVGDFAQGITIAYIEKGEKMGTKK